MNQSNNPYAANSKSAERMKYYESRLKAVFANERKSHEISGLEKVMEEIEKLTFRTRLYLNECRQAMQIRDSMLKLTMEITDINVAKSVLQKMPELPHRYDSRPKVLDDALLAFLILGAYIKPNFSDEEECGVRALPIPICVEEEIYHEIAKREELRKQAEENESDIPEIEIIDECPNCAQSPDPEPIQCAQNPVFTERVENENEQNDWLKRLTADLDEK